MVQTYDRLVFVQHLVVLGQGDEENEGGDVLETVNPLLPLGALTTDVEELVCQFTDLECRLGDTGRLYTRAEDILVSWKIARRCRGYGPRCGIAGCSLCWRACRAGRRSPCVMMIYSRSRDISDQLADKSGCWTSCLEWPVGTAVLQRATEGAV